MHVCKHFSRFVCTQISTSEYTQSFYTSGPADIGRDNQELKVKPTAARPAKISAANCFTFVATVRRGAEISSE